jgi:hypothetical protein
VRHRGLAIPDVDNPRSPEEAVAAFEAAHGPETEARSNVVGEAPAPGADQLVAIALGTSYEHNGCLSDAKFRAHSSFNLRDMNNDRNMISGGNASDFVGDFYGFLVRP